MQSFSTSSLQPKSRCAVQARELYTMLSTGRFDSKCHTIVAGFIHRIETETKKVNKTFEIPSDIIHLCFLFYWKYDVLEDCIFMIHLC